MFLKKLALLFFIKQPKPLSIISNISKISKIYNKDYTISWEFVKKTLFPILFSAYSAKNLGWRGILEFLYSRLTLTNPQ